MYDRIYLSKINLAGNIRCCAGFFSAQHLREENPFELLQWEQVAAALAEEERALQSSDDEVRHFVVLHGARHFAGFDSRFQAIDDAAL